MSLLPPLGLSSMRSATMLPLLSMKPRTFDLLAARNPARLVNLVKLVIWIDLPNI